MIPKAPIWHFGELTYAPTLRHSALFRSGGRRHARLHQSRSGAATSGVTDCLASLRQQFGRPQCEIDIARRTTIPTNQATAVQLEVVVCTTGPMHLLDRLPLGPGYFTQLRTAALPPMLGFECHAAVGQRLGEFDFYCYLEDDLVIRDPWFFVKLRWFAAQFGDEPLLMPNRYELACDRIVHKAYVDGALRPEVAAPFQNVADVPTLESEVMGQRIEFRRTLNPHAGCFFLNARQMAAWADKPYFLDRDSRSSGRWKVAASLGVMRTFRIYKPADRRRVSGNRTSGRAIPHVDSPAGPERNYFAFTRLSTSRKSLPPDVEANFVGRAEPGSP